MGGPAAIPNGASIASARLGALAAVLVTLALSSGAAQAAPFSNPVVPQSASGADSPDPWIFRAAGKYFITHTSGDHIELSSSRSLAGLASAPPRTLWTPDRGPAGACCNLWAPELHRLPDPAGGQRWYLYYTAGPGDVNRQRMHVLAGSRRHPWGPYRYAGELDTGPRYAIDANVLRLARRSYLLFSAASADIFAPTSLYIAELSTPSSLTGVPVEISQPEQPWEAVPFPINEGPQALRHRGLLHVIYSASWCGTPEYKLGRLTVPASANLLDPATWAAAKHPAPVFVTSEQAGIFGPGHGSFFRSPDGREDWMVYHATDDARGCFTGGTRLTYAKRFRWLADGSPDFGSPPAPSAVLPLPGGDPSRAWQAERSLSPARGALAEEVRDRRLVAGAGIAVTPDARGTLGFFKWRGRWPAQVAVRVLLPSPAFGLRVFDARSGRRLGGGRVRGAVGEGREVRVRRVRLRRGRKTLRLAVKDMIGAPVVIDQIRVTPAKRRSAKRR